MNFTKREIELAKQLKESGIEWKPSRYDKVLFIDHILCLVDVLDTQPSLVCYNPLLLSYSFSYLGYREVTWLPLWHQAREILSGFTPFIFNGKPPVLTLQTWQFTGDTDLEAMYRAILGLKEEGKIKCLK